jgi:hypothetical protein
MFTKLMPSVKFFVSQIDVRLVIFLVVVVLLVLGAGAPGAVGIR